MLTWGGPEVLSAVPVLPCPHSAPSTPEKATLPTDAQGLGGGGSKGELRKATVNHGPPGWLPTGAQRGPPPAPAHLLPADTRVGHVAL